jgi:pyruvate dehydrogenase E2 component (dihydrolipoamide acetyltransferase)
MKLSVIAFAILVCAAMVFAQATPPATPEAAAPAAAAEKAPAKKAKPAITKGTVVSVDEAAGTILVKTAKGEETVATDAATAVTVGGKKAALVDVKAEMGVSVTSVEKDGKVCAKKVAAKASKAAKKAAAAPAAEATPAPAAAEATPAPAAAPAAPAAK